MKLPSLFRTANYQRFEIKPRYYDPIKEEMEERTSRIRKELEQEGLIDETDTHVRQRLAGGGIRGSFAQYRGKTKNPGVFSSSSMIRTILFFVMMVGVFGYIYIGPAILNYLLYGTLIVGGCYYVFRLLKRKGNDE